MSRIARTVLFALPLLFAACPGPALILSADSGRMQELGEPGDSGISVRFQVPDDADLTAFQFFGCRAGERGAPSDVFLVSVRDGEGNVLRELEKPLWNIGAGQPLWQTVSVSPPVRVKGEFEIRISRDPSARSALRIGRDGPAGSGRWMVRAHLRDPSWTAPLPASSSPSSSAGPRPASSAATAAGTQWRPMAAAAPSGRGELAYRDQHRRLSFPRRPPPIPRGCGRLDIRWDRTPVTVELSYVGKPPRVLEGLDARRLVVDLPVPEPGLFEVTVRMEGFPPQSRRFLVSAGSREEWHIRFQPGGRGEGPEKDGQRPLAPVIIEEVTGP